MAQYEDNRDTTADKTKLREDFQKVCLIRQLVEQYLSDEKLEQRIELQMKMDCSALSSLVEQVLGSSLQTYIVQERMRNAQRMLLESSASITSIAKAVGYASALSFTSEFRQQFKVAPTVFRRTASPEQLLSSGGMQHWG